MTTSSSCCVDMSLAVPQGKIVALLGSNGAGKSTTLKAISGLLPTEHGEVTDGSIVFDGQDITHLDAAARVKIGPVALCMEGRHVFEHLTVRGEPPRRERTSAVAARLPTSSRSTGCCPSSVT
jgi:ABC-type branched-subunit amino acid transport system ATPase component